MARSSGEVTCHRDFHQTERQLTATRCGDIARARKINGRRHSGGKHEKKSLLRTGSIACLVGF
jgi:hypothetical protein